MRRVPEDANARYMVAWDTGPTDKLTKDPEWRRQLLTMRGTVTKRLFCDIPGSHGNARGAECDPA